MNYVRLNQFLLVGILFWAAQTVKAVSIACCSEPLSWGWFPAGSASIISMSPFESAESTDLDGAIWLMSSGVLIELGIVDVTIDFDSSEDLG